MYNNFNGRWLLFWITVILLLGGMFIVALLSYYLEGVLMQDLALHYTHVGPSLHSIEASLTRTLSYFFLFVSIIFALLFLLYGWMLYRNFVNPLIDFTKRMQRISEEQQLDHRIDLDSPVLEIRRMQQVFNDMMEQIEYYYDRTVVGLFVDSLTSLPNMMALKRDLQQTENPTLILLNINQFRDINEFYGYIVGDYILMEFADSLEAFTKPGDTLYRLGGDEFVWLTTQEHFDMQELLETLETFHNHVYKYDGIELMISLSCGIALEGEHLISKAASALETAKMKSRPIEVYNAADDDKQTTKHNLYWSVKLKEALDEDRIVTYYQPILQNGAKHYEKFECLARLIEPDGTVSTPGQFMEAAKRSRLYLRMTRNIVKHAFSYFRERDAEFSVNLSIDDILDFPTRHTIMNQLRQFPNPSRVIFEIVETEEITDFDAMADFIREIKSFGAKIAIDDFGSGFANYGYVLKLHADYLKIDSSLIKEIDSDPEARVIVESIVKSAKKLGMKTIAEFVHNESVMKQVTELGVDYLQGFHISQPVADIEDA